jgi:ribokinase
MAIYNLGSINIDNFYQVAHIPTPGETIAAGHMSVGLGGKGANMSVAAARGAARVVHIGAIGVGGTWTRDRLMEYGVDTRFIIDGTRTGHAIICVAEDGENAITLFTGANHEITSDLIGSSLSEAQTGDIFVTQNETNAQAQACEMAKRLGLRVAYAAAPFDAGAVQAVLPHIDMLIMNQVEADQLTNALGLRPDQLDVQDLIVTLGADGCRWFDNQMGRVHEHAAIPADIVDTTGAGDTFTGYILAGLDRGMPMEQAIRLASQAASIMVSRQGTADVIPDLKDIQDKFGNV